MKKILCLIVCSAVISALASCSFFEGGNASEDSTEVRNIAALPDSVMKQLAKQDSAMNILTEKVNALANGLNKAQDENVKLKEEVAELKKPHALVTIVSIGALFLAFVALIVALLMPRGIKKTVVGIVKQCLDSSTRIKKLQNDMEEMKLLQQKSTSKSTVTYAPSNHDSRVEWLERRMSQAEQAIQNISQPPVQPAKPFVETGGQRVGYAKNESGLYFFTIFDSAQEGCRGLCLCCPMRR